MAALLHPALFYYRVSLLIKNCLVECVVSRETNPVMLFSQNLFKPLLSHLKIMENKTYVSPGAALVKRAEKQCLQKRFYERGRKC